MNNNLTLDSKLSDLLAIDLPRTAILKDIHIDITNAILGLKMNEGVKLDWFRFISECELYQYENFYRFWVEYAFTDYKDPPAIFLEVLFIYGLLLPYYLDYTKTDFRHLDHFTKKPNEQFRVIKPLNNDDYPHPFSLHHAHQLTKILIAKCNQFNSHAYQNAIKTNDKNQEKRRWLTRAYIYVNRQHPNITKTQLVDKMLDFLENDDKEKLWLYDVINTHAPSDSRPQLIDKMLNTFKNQSKENKNNYEYNSDSVKNTVSNFKKGKFFKITWAELINIQSELLAYIRTMPTL